MFKDSVTLRDVTKIAKIDQKHQNYIPPIHCCLLDWFSKFGI